jgi:hypothetical protein
VTGAASGVADDTASGLAAVGSAVSEPAGWAQADTGAVGVGTSGIDTTGTSSNADTGTSTWGSSTGLGTSETPASTTSYGGTTSSYGATGTTADSGSQATTAMPVQQAAAASSTPAGWYPDPSGRYELRYWDGSAWTEHVSRQGQQFTDPPVA